METQDYGTVTKQ